MKPEERIDYLIKMLTGNNARMFAEKAHIRPDSLSRARKGINAPSAYFQRILEAFPNVRREWLVDGRGEPLVEDEERSEIAERLASLEAEVKRLSDLVESLATRWLKNEKFSQKSAKNNKQKKMKNGPTGA